MQPLQDTQDLTLPLFTSKIAVAIGDGIGPEIMEATLKILFAAGAKLDVTTIEVGEQVYRSGETSGIDPNAWEILRDRRVLLKSPITTPQGGGYKSLNVTLRKTLGLYANVRPCRAYAPFIETHHPDMDVVIVRENEEDLYAGIEHRQTQEVYQCLKLMTEPGCRRIVRYAFEYARRQGRQKVTCLTKDNIMKLTDGLFHRVFDEISANYPDIQSDHMIVDIGMARIANKPEQFDVMVTPNLYGDIVSDIVAETAGSVGLAGSANIGEHCSMFEAIHGSAPQIAGQGVANPSGLLLASVMMLCHLGQHNVAQKVHNAWLKTIEDGVHTQDIYSGASSLLVGTAAFAEAVCKRLGEEPARFEPVRYRYVEPILADQTETVEVLQKKETIGVDVFVEHRGSAEELAVQLQRAAGPTLKLQMITNRGVKVWPKGQPTTSLVDHWRCRFFASEGGPINLSVIATLLQDLAKAGVEYIKTENLCTFDGVPGFSLGQGQ